MQTTLAAIRSHAPCVDGWRNAQRVIATTFPGTDNLAIRDILRAVGLDDALWCLRAVDGWDSELRLLSASFARDVQHLMTDTRSLRAVGVVEQSGLGAVSAETITATHNEATAAAKGCYERAIAEGASAYSWAMWAAAEAAVAASSGGHPGVTVWHTAAEAAWAAALAVEVSPSDTRWMAAIAAETVAERLAAIQAAGNAPWVRAFAAARIDQGRRLALMCAA